MTQFGFLIGNCTALNLTIYAAAWSFQILRIRAEEAILLKDPIYESYARCVQWRVVPGLY